MNFLRGSIAVVVFWAVLLSAYFRPDWLMIGIAALMLVLLSGCVFFIFTEGLE